MLQAIETKQDVSDKFSIALAQLIFDMQAYGYECKAPTQEVAELDATIVSGWPCERCRGTLHYEPFTKYNSLGQRSSYRPFTVCETCGQVREF